MLWRSKREAVLFGFTGAYGHTGTRAHGHTLGYVPCLGVRTFRA